MTVHTDNSIFLHINVTPWESLEMTFSGDHFELRTTKIDVIATTMGQNKIDTIWKHLHANIIN